MLADPEPLTSSEKASPRRRSIATLPAPLSEAWARSGVPTLIVTGPAGWSGLPPQDERSART